MRFPADLLSSAWDVTNSRKAADTQGNREPNPTREGAKVAGLQVILSTIRVFVLAANEADAYRPPATAIQRSKHCQTRVSSQKQPCRAVGHEPLPIRGGQTLARVRRACVRHAAYWPVYKTGLPQKKRRGSELVPFSNAAQCAGWLSSRRPICMAAHSHTHRPCTASHGWA